MSLANQDPIDKDPGHKSKTNGRRNIGPVKPDQAQVNLAQEKNRQNLCQRTADDHRDIHEAEIDDSVSGKTYK